MILVAACLLGVNCRYDGNSCKNEKVLEYIKDKNIIPICPEQLGGLATPRMPVEIAEGDGSTVLEGNGKVVNKEGEDVSEAFLKGAYETLKIAKLFNCKEAILKAKSPSCGSKKIYDGTFNGVLKKGKGITAALLEKEGIKVKSEENL